MWGGNWNFLAAENIDGINSVIWKYTDRSGGADSFLLTLHDENWDYYNERYAGWQGDPRYDDPPDQEFYKTETSFNIDFNEDGRIGAPPAPSNNPPFLAGDQSLLPEASPGEPYSLNISDLLRGYTDPDGDHL